MLTAALIALVIAALGGIVMARHIFKGGPPPTAIAVVHGIAVATGIALMIIFIVTEVAEDTATWALILSLLTATGGAYLVSRHIGHKTHPRKVVVMHGLLAVITIIVLGFAAF